MGVRYWVLVAEELLDAGLEFPEGLRLAGRGGAERGGARWCRFEDDGAPAEPEGKEVELIFGTAHGQNVITERRVIR